MKRTLALLAAALVAAAVLLRPVPPPASGASGWSSAGPDAPDRRGRGDRRTPSPHAMVYVAGEVVRPGVYPVGPEARTRDVLALAGGTRPDADLIAVNLAAHLRDGDEIVVPVRGAALSSATARSSRGRGRGYGGNPRRAGESRGVSSADSADSAYRSGGKHRASGRGRRGRGARSGGEGPPPVAEVDINTADAETLATIPGIGDGLARRIVLFREQNGAFASVDELLDVAGITEHRLDAMIPYVVAR